MVSLNEDEVATLDNTPCNSLPIDVSSEKSTLSSFLKIISTKVPTVSSIPKPVRLDVLKELTRVNNLVISDTLNLQNLAYLLMFSKCVLRRLPSSNINARKKRKIQIALIRDSLRKWCLGTESRKRLWIEVCSLSNNSRDASSVFNQLDEDSQFIKNVARAKILASQGRLSDALKALESAGFATMSEEVLGILSEKHPYAPPTSCFSTAECVSWTSSTESVKEKALSFNSGSAAGLDGFHPQYFKDLNSVKVSDALISFWSSQTNLVNISLHGKLPPIFSDVLGAANLIALLKKDGGIRPIAVSLVWRRLVSKIVNGKVIKKARDLFKNQVGCGTPGGAEAVIFAVQKVITDMGDNIDKVLFKVDFANAFNTVSRSKMFEAVNKYLPEILSWVQYIYSNTPYLVCNNSNVLKSYTGTQQGDPLGPLLFCLVILRSFRKD